MTFKCRWLLNRGDHLGRFDCILKNSKTVPLVMPANQMHKPPLQREQDLNKWLVLTFTERGILRPYPSYLIFLVTIKTIQPKAANLLRIGICVCKFFHQSIQFDWGYVIIDQSKFDIRLTCPLLKTKVDSLFKVEFWVNYDY